MRTEASQRAGTLQAPSVSPVPGRPDLLEFYEPGGFFFERDGCGVVASGTALAINVPAGPDQVARAAAEVAAVLEEIAPPRGPAPVVVGALPFDGSRPALLVVPRVAIRRQADGGTWRLAFGPPRERAAAPEARRGLAPARGDCAEGCVGRSLHVRAVPEPCEFEAAVRTALGRIGAGSLQKVVLARALSVESDRDFDPRALLAHLRAREPASYAFAADGLVGASPELLVSRSGRMVRSNPLAGSAPRGSNAEADEEAARRLLASDKDNREHEFVVNAVREGLEPFCERLGAPPEPALSRTSAIWHLSTEVRGRLREPDPGALALAAALHPTPAVCGTPTAAALSAIRDLEPLDRGLYAGVVGWMDARGDGEWAVAIRCAELDGAGARLFAGAGIVAGSDPAAELAETDAKFRVLLDALRYA